MPDSKYGRLFTERDVRRIVSYARREGAPDDPMETVAALDADQTRPDRHMTFPADEPLFLLRAQDKAVDGNLLAVYFNVAEDAGTSEEHLKGIVIAMRDFTQWKRDHPERVKVPD